MARVGIQQANFGGGVLSPRLMGRTDVAKYASGAEAIENFIVRPEGGLMRRHGSRFAGEVVNHAKKPRLREFIFSNADKIMLVFEDLLLRFYKGTAPITSSTKNITGISNANPAVVTSNAHGFANGDRVVIAGVGGMGQVNNREFTVANQTANTFELSGIDSTAYDVYTAGGTVSKIYTIATAYVEADLPTLFFAQSADVVFIAHPNYAPMQLSRLSDTNWTLAAIAQAKGPFANLNTDDTVRVLCAGLSGSSHQPGDPVSVQANTAIFTANHVGSYYRMQELYLSDNDVSPWAPSLPIGGIGAQKSSNGHVYSLVAAGGGLVTGGYVAGVVAPSHTDGDAWDSPTGATDYDKWRYLHSRWAIVKLTAFVDAKNMTGTITTYLCDGLAPTAKNVTNVVNAGGLCRCTSNAHGYNEGDYVTVTGVTGATQANGDWKIVGVTVNTFDLAGSSPPGAFVGAGTVKRYSTWLWHFGAFSAARGFPSCVALHEQRLTFADTTTQPTGIWASRSGDYGNFYPGTNDNDSISYNIAAGQADPIRWIASGQDLLLGTLNQEFAGYGGGLGDPITPTNTRIIPQSGEGAVNVQPIKVGSDVLFVDRSARRLMAYGLQQAQTSVTPYGATDLLQLAEHLAPTNKTIVAIAWAKNPCRALWVLRSDGSLICGTKQVDQVVPAWVTCPVNGFVESIAVMPSSDGTTDDLWMAVRRTINGGTRRYIEYLAPPFEPTSPTDKDLMGFLDSALRYTGPAVSALSGMFHLEGQSVKIVANGALHADRVVSGGKLALDLSATNVWAGLAYASRVRTLRPEAGAVGTAQGKTKRIPRISVNVLNAIGGTIGPGSEGTMDELIKREADDPMDASPPMRSGFYDSYIASDFDVDGRIAIVQSDPLPLDILSIAPLINVTEP